MKHILSVLLCLLFFQTLSWSDVNSGKLDPYLGLLTVYPERIHIVKEQTEILEKQKSASLDVIVTFRNQLKGISKIGGQIVCSYKDMAVCTIPYYKLDELASLENVVYIEHSYKSIATLDKSAPAISVSRAKQDFNLYGENVIVGIIDSGIDWQHESFRDRDGKTRIKYILDLSQAGSVYGGTVFTEEDINAGLNANRILDHYDFSGHGTHIAGIAAGSGHYLDKSTSYVGMAPQSDLVVVKASRDELGNQFLAKDQIIALTFIDSIASVLEKPYVANLSFGGHNGAHDGTASVERYIDRLTGNGIPGKAIVTVAGNDRENDIHAVTEPGTGIPVKFTISSYVPSVNSNNDYIQLSAWYSGDARVSIKITSPDNQSFGPVHAGNVLREKTTKGNVYVWNGFYEKGSSYQSGVNPFNGDREIYIEISDAESSDPPAEGEWKLHFEGNSEKVDVYLAYSSMDARFTSKSVDYGKLSIPGTAKNVITVGSFVTKTTWTDSDGNRLTLSNLSGVKIGNISTFSSPGPTRDGRIKPDCAAPGEMIASVRSEFAEPSNSNSIYFSNSGDYPNAYILDDDGFGISSGTSMAAPHVTGLVALVLENYPNISVSQIVQIIKVSANSENIPKTPNSDWGWGKIDAYKLLQLVPEQENPTEYNLIHAFPNPFSDITRIEFDLPLNNPVPKTVIKIYNILGQEVKTLLSEKLAAGNHFRYWDGKGRNGLQLAAGIYFIEMHAGTFYQVKKLAFLGQR